MSKTIGMMAFEEEMERQTQFVIKQVTPILDTLEAVLWRYDRPGDIIVADAKEKLADWRIRFNPKQVRGND